MHDFSHAQRTFVHGITHGFVDDSTDRHMVELVLVGFFIFLGAVLVAYFIHKKWFYVRRAILARYHILQGHPAGRWRMADRLDVCIFLPKIRSGMLRTSTFNLSPQGMFVRMPAPLPKGEVFQFDLELANRQYVSASAEVVWSQNKYSPYHPTGMGCRMIGLNDTEKNRIRLYLQRKRESAAEKKTQLRLRRS